jgi:hypothetical protein
MAECLVRQPPTELQSPPSVSFRVWPVPVTHIDFFCNSFDAPYGLVEGCSVEDEGGWLIYIRDDLGDEETECILRHEKAHLPPNNWDHGPSWPAYFDGGVWRTKLSSGPISRGVAGRAAVMERFKARPKLDRSLRFE